MNRSDILWRDGEDSYATSVRLPKCSTGEAKRVGAVGGGALGFMVPDFSEGRRPL